MIDIVSLLLMFVFGTGAFYTFQRKMELNRRYWTSMRAAVREWDAESALDARKAVREELWWTVGFILFVIGWVIGLIGWLQ